MDGSPARHVPVELEGVDQPAVLTMVRTVDTVGVETESVSADCRRDRFAGTRATGVAVERLGVGSESVTLRDGMRRGLYGCDNTAGAREENRRWCGGSYGELFDGRLRDPRLDLGCVTSDGKPVGFAWVEPSPGTRYVAVQQPGFTEVYEVADGLPVRVATTSGVRVEGSSAVFDLSEHDADGRLLRRYRLEAHVAG